MSQLNYKIIYHIPGFSRSPDPDPFQMWTDGANTAYLSSDLSGFVEGVDRGSALPPGFNPG